ncbi:uncharacterized protein EDB93DRAFT_1337362 [Suillus bovinus]|uniref:uncharacterized protein n=1 Tax=Suillus bovinus TaxID=48563 RepID=UPI001B87EB9B|nr:uncharacterized protein EDB93DRAFT_1337362 [Suillus bovinus]KAG2147415.1 hypothetical protein EDB93DRAFT_1337362 [Suillus bovinus]
MDLTPSRTPVTFIQRPHWQDRNIRDARRSIKNVPFVRHLNVAKSTSLSETRGMEACTDCRCSTIPTNTRLELLFALRNLFQRYKLVGRILSVQRSVMLENFEDRLNEFDRAITTFEDLSFNGTLLTVGIRGRILLTRSKPTYEEMKAGAATGPGYEKLLNFCAKAREHGMEFAWSDTCCIDRNSSTELDESIRSMFRWYRNSYICIVHLAQSMIVEDILDDEWTTRGWTLQELLAPCLIKFFNKRPSKVDERMTWAARRKTTRVEDVANSLVDIFDVSLQIAYGEGGDRAFCRLIEAIMQAGDPSVLNWKGEAAKHHTSHAIPRSPQSFVDHRELKLTSRRLEMTMTGLGLRVPLVILPLNLHSLTYDYVSRVTLDCPLCPTSMLSALSTTHSSTDFVGLGNVSSRKQHFEPWMPVRQEGLVEVNFPNIPTHFDEQDP